MALNNDGHTPLSSVVAEFLQPVHVVNGAVVAVGTAALGTSVSSGLQNFLPFSMSAPVSIAAVSYISAVIGFVVVQNTIGPAWLYR